MIFYSPTQYIWKHGQEQTATNTTASPQANPAAETVSVPNTPVVEITPPAADQAIETPQPPTDINPITDNQPNVHLAEVIPPVAKENEEVLKPQTITDPQTESVSTPTTIQTNLESQASIEPQASIQLPTDTKPSLDVQTNTPAVPSVPNAQPEIVNLPIPFTPTTPNTLVGLTLTPDGHILDGVMVEIKNQNLTLRATKSNKLGQFLFARPLENGLYQILAEKENYKFETYSIDLTGEIINPLKIQATK